MRILALVLLLAAFLWQCKLRRAGEVESIRAADDALKVAVNYIGHQACKTYYGEEKDKGEKVIQRNISQSRQILTHLIDGPNGELISEEYRASTPQRKGLLLSGDRFFQQYRTKDSPLDMQMIIDNCRRLVLSVDSDIPPTITFDKDGGGALVGSKKELQLMDPGNVLEGVECLADQPFCSFKCGTGSNAICRTKKRYYVLVWPDKEKRQVKAVVKWNADGKEDSSSITIPHLTYQGDVPALWKPSAVQPTEKSETEETEKTEETEETEKTEEAEKTEETEKPETPAVTQQPPASNKVYNAEGLATLSVLAATRKAANRAIITLAFTALQDIKKNGKIKIFSNRPYKVTGGRFRVSVPQEIFSHNEDSPLYSGNKFMEMRVDENWNKDKRGTIDFEVQLNAQESATFKAQISKPAILLRQWKTFRDSMYSDSITVTVP